MCERKTPYVKATERGERGGGDKKHREREIDRERERERERETGRNREKTKKRKKSLGERENYRKKEID